MFMTPPAVPLRPPATSIIAAQNGPSTERTSAVASARHTAATRASGVRAPYERNAAPPMSPAIGTIRRPQAGPSLFTSASETAPPSGIETIERSHGRLA